MMGAVGWGWLYGALVALRLASVALPGYVHADEFFQSPEEMAGAVLGAEINRAWEFDSTGEPARAVLPVAIVSGAPFWVLRAAAGEQGRNAWILLVAPRIVAVLLSFAIDAALVALCRRSAADPRPALLCLASSVVMLVFQTRPFSNALEAVVLAAALVAATAGPAPAGPLEAATSEAPPPTRAAAVLGVLAAVGVFTRVTFPAFAAPLGVAFLWNDACDARSGLGRAGRLAAVAISAAACTATVFAGVDAWYFGALAVDLAAFGPWATQPWTAVAPLQGRLLWTPWNNLRYNLRPENLSEHTLHPRWLHALVNVPALFGPLVALALVGARTAPSLPPAAVPTSSSPRALPAARPHAPSSRWPGPRRRWAPTEVAAACAVSAVAILSAVSHQEPRFLVPLLLPLVLAAAPALQRAPRWWWALWFALNTLAGVGYGVLHQGGVVPSLIYIDAQLHAAAAAGPWRLCDGGAQRPCPLHVIYAHTYMPPHHLVERNQTTLAPLGRPDLAVHIHDVSGRGPDAVVAVVRRACEQAAADAAAVRVVLVTPGHFPHGQLAGQLEVGPALAAFGPHLGTEHLESYLARPLTWRTWTVEVAPVLHPCGV